MYNNTSVVSPMIPVVCTLIVVIMVMVVPGYATKCDFKKLQPIVSITMIVCGKPSGNDVATFETQQRHVRSWFGVHLTATAVADLSVLDRYWLHFIIYTAHNEKLHLLLRTSIVFRIILVFHSFIDTMFIYILFWFQQSLY